MIMGLKPHLNDSHEWGCEVYVKILQADKLEAQAMTARWIGHVNLSHGIIFIGLTLIRYLSKEMLFS
jgi:hypothetical protein